MTIALSLGGIGTALAQEAPASPTTTSAATASGYRFELFTSQPDASAQAAGSITIGSTATDLAGLNAQNSGAHYMRITDAAGASGVYRVMVNPFNGRIFVFTANGIRPLDKFLAEGGFTVSGNTATAPTSLSLAAPYGDGTSALAASSDATASAQSTTDTSAATPAAPADASAATPAAPADASAAAPAAPADASAAAPAAPADASAAAPAAPADTSAAASTTPADTSAAASTTPADTSAAAPAAPADTSAAAPADTSAAAPADTSAAASTTAPADTSAAASTPADTSTAAATTPADTSAAASTTAPADTSAAASTTPADTSTAASTTPADTSTAAASTAPADTSAAASTTTTEAAASTTTSTTTEAAASSTAEVSVNETALADTYQASLGDISLSVVPAARPLPASNATSLAIAPFNTATDAKYAIAGNVVTLNYTSDAKLEDIVAFYRSQLEGQGFTFDADAAQNGVVSEGSAVLVMWRGDKPVTVTISRDEGSNLVKVEADLNELVTAE